LQAIIFKGLQEGGKTTFYAERFLKTHLRISLDMLKTRNKKGLLSQTCLATEQKFVIDNTRATNADRKRYIEAAREACFEVVGYFLSLLFRRPWSGITSGPEKKSYPLPVLGLRIKKAAGNQSGRL
jgi:hypothetical protein